MTACRFPSKVVDRHFVDQDDRPFFWLGDTAWELVHRLNATEIEHYADVRARQGFNVCQLVLLAELNGLHTANADGDLPLKDDDPTDPDPAYFAHVDLAVRLLNERGIVACLLPTWGDKFNKKWGEGPEVFTPDNAAVFGDWLGDRYRDAAVVWMLGGDRPCESDLHREIVHAMSDGLRYGHGGRHLHTYHPSGGSSSIDAYGSDPNWLNFYCIQGGHTKTDKGVVLMRKALGQTDKPVLESEPAYEDHPRMSDDWQSHDGHFTADEVMARLWRAILAGSPGVTYGCHPVWQMHDPTQGHAGKNSPRRSWREALTLPVAEQVHRLRETFEPIPWWTLRPDGENVAASEDGSLRVEYLPGEDRVLVTR